MLEGVNDLLKKQKKVKFPWNTAFAIALKWTKLPVLFVTFKALKSVKYLISIGSLFVSTILYGIALGPWFGVGLVAMLLIHEMGHVWAAKRRGVPASLPFFIPFLGAAIFIPEQKDRHEEAYIGYGGPFIGSLAAFGLLGYCLVMNPAGKMGEILLLVAFVGLWLNLFNLIPLRPLDGGRILQASGSWYKWIGAVLLLYFTVMIGQAGMFLIWILVIDDLVKRPTTKFTAGVAFYLAMLSMIIFGGMSHQSILVDCIDILIGILFVLSYYSQRNEYLRKVADGTTVESRSDTRHFPSPSIRLGWTIAYIVLAGVLWLGMEVAKKRLPQEIHTHTSVGLIR